MSLFTELGAALNPASAQQIIASATVYRARVGTRPAYPLLAGALAFEEGWHAYHDGLWCPVSAPASTGWLVAETQDAKAREARENERAE